MLDIPQIYQDTGALSKGHFLLSSGNHSDTYLQSARVLESPKRAQILLEELCKLIKSHNIMPDTICSPAIGGVLAGYELARAFDVRFIFTERVNSVMTLRRDFKVQKGEKILICEDVITTGGSALESSVCVKEKGANIIAFAGLASRGFCSAVLPTLLSTPDSAKWHSTDPKNLCKLPKDIPLFVLHDFIFDTFAPSECPLCKTSVAIKPGSRGN